MTNLGEEVLASKQNKHDGRREDHIEESCLRVEIRFVFDNHHRLVKERAYENCAFRIDVMQLDH